MEYFLSTLFLKILPHKVWDSSEPSIQSFVLYQKILVQTLCSIMACIHSYVDGVATNEKWWTEPKLKLIRKKVFDARAAYWILNFDVLEVYALNVSSSLHGQYPNSFYAVSYIIPLNCITIYYFSSKFLLGNKVYSNLI